ncbi:alpha/beta fold hydrolase [Sphingopyxis sp. H115]|uniref:alpha/beta fold hydrolase n=1 Tax=Sphingopyxis sp. H115 TaxID=1759073 RepID=UPI000A8D3E2C|nr:alpha/beta hydrolase [Sphingopyxis sp. H115]
MNRRQIMSFAGLAAAGALVAPPRSHAALPAAKRSAESFVAAKDGTSLFVRDWGAGKPVLFLAGWALPSDFWGYQMLAVARKGYRAIAYDRRGHGRSADPGRGYDHDTLADDLASIIGALALDGVTIVAHSMGGTEVARYFARHGGRGVARVILVGTITPCLVKRPDNPDGIDPATLAAGADLLARDFPAWVAANTKPFFTPDTSGAMVAWGQNMMMSTSLFGAVQLAQANFATDFRADVRRIGVPALVVHGDRDASAPLAITARATAALLPDAILSIYEGAPHGLPLTHVERLNAEILAFMAKA